MWQGRKVGEVYLPTAEEIRVECEKFQAGWGERERLLRAGFKPDAAFLTVPTIKAGDLTAEMEDSTP